MALLTNPKFLLGGLIGTLLCCFTPILIVLFGLLGLGALTGYLDYALMPLLGFFIAALARVAGWRGNRTVAGAGGIVVFLGFALLFGRSQPLYAVLMAVGALLAFVAIRH